MLPNRSTVAVLFKPTTFVRLKMFVDSAMNSRLIALAERKQTSVAYVELRRARCAECVAPDEERALERA